MCHAALEKYCEEVAANAVENRVKKFRASGDVSEMLVTLAVARMISWHTGEPDDDVLTFAKVSRPDELMREAVFHAVGKYRDILRQNNGIKVKNLKRIFLPLGVNFRELDEAWLAGMESFGTARGEIAHSSIGLLHPVDPASERDTVMSLYAGLAALDGQVVKLGGL